MLRSSASNLEQAELGRQCIPKFGNDIENQLFIGNVSRLARLYIAYLLTSPCIDLKDGR